MVGWLFVGNGGACGEWYTYLGEESKLGDSIQKGDGFQEKPIPFIEAAILRYFTA